MLRLINLLELPAPFSRPTFDHDLGLSEEFDGVFSLSMQVAEEAILPAAEREERHRGGYTNIDADIARVCLVAELTRRGTVAGENGSHIAILTVI